MLVHVGEYCEVVCLPTAVQTVMEQQILSKIPVALKLLNVCKIVRFDEKVLMWKYLRKPELFVIERPLPWDHL